MHFFDDDDPYIIIIPRHSYRRRSRLFRLLMFALKLALLAVFALFCYYNIPFLIAKAIRTIQSMLF